MSKKTHQESQPLPGIDELPPRQIVKRVREVKARAALLTQQRALLLDHSEPHLEPRDGHDPLDLAQSGWGVVFPDNADPAIEKALVPLLAHRQEAAASLSERRFRIYRDKDGYHPKEEAQAFRETRRGALGAVNPDRMPYYLLLVGDPEEIPFGFQSQLGLRHAVGRLSFPRVEDYAKYALAVVEAEDSPPLTLPRRLSFFASRFEDDDTSKVLSDALIGTLFERLQRPDLPFWKLRRFIGDGASKQCLTDLLGSSAPDLLFVACHGQAFALDNEYRRERQGAILCQGPQPRPFFAAQDLHRVAASPSPITLLCGCHTGGVPTSRDFDELSGETETLGESFVSRLVQGLLSRPSGAALAVMAHVGRAYGHSFIGPLRTLQTETFEDLVARLMRGDTVGWAHEVMTRQAAHAASEFWSRRDLDWSIGSNGPTADQMVRMFNKARDAAGYLIFGDPAVRLPEGETF